MEPSTVLYSTLDGGKVGKVHGKAETKQRGSAHLSHARVSLQCPSHSNMRRRHSLEKVRQEHKPRCSAAVAVAAIGISINKSIDLVAIKTLAL